MNYNPIMIKEIGNKIILHLLQEVWDNGKSQEYHDVKLSDFLLDFSEGDVNLAELQLCLQYFLVARRIYLDSRFKVFFPGWSSNDFTVMPFSCFSSGGGKIKVHLEEHVENIVISNEENYKEIQKKLID